MKYIVYSCLFFISALSINAQSMPDSLEWIEKNVEHLSNGNAGKHEFGHFSFSYNSDGSNIRISYAYTDGFLDRWWYRELTFDLADIDPDEIVLGSDYLKLYTHNEREIISVTGYNISYPSGKALTGQNHKMMRSYVRIVSDDLDGEMGDRILKAFEHVVGLANGNSDLF